MGLFSSTPEEREAKKRMQEEAKKAKEEKKKEKAQAKLNAFMKEHGLAGIDKSSQKQIERIQSQLWGTSLYGTFSNKETDQLWDLLQVQQGIIEQNWLVIKQQDQIIKELREINKDN